MGIHRQEEAILIAWMRKSKDKIRIIPAVVSLLLVVPIIITGIVATEDSNLRVESFFILSSGVGTIVVVTILVLVKVAGDVVRVGTKSLENRSEQQTSQGLLDFKRRFDKVKGAVIVILFCGTGYLIYTTFYIPGAKFLFARITYSSLAISLAIIAAAQGLFLGGFGFKMKGGESTDKKFIYQKAGEAERGAKRRTRSNNIDE